MKRNGSILIALAALLLFVTGCAERQGKSGKTGAAGPAGPAGISATSVIQESISITVQSVSIPADGKPVVKFQLLDQDQLAYSKLTLGSNLASANLRVTLAKFVPASSAAPAHWQNYLNSTQTKTSSKPGVWANPAISQRTSTQPTTEGSTAFPAGTLAYNATTQVYTYIFAQAISAITTPVAVTYSASATHRVGMELRNLTDSNGDPLGADATFDFVPAGGTATSYEVVDTSTCNGCHNKLAAHGEARFSVKYCVVCHNPDNSDPNGGDVYEMAAGNPLDFPIMVHRIHSGGLLPSYIDGQLPYTIWGFGDAPAIFTGSLPVMTIGRSASASSTNTKSGDALYMRTTAGTGIALFFPDCVKCHVEGTGAPAQAANWKNTPSQQVCTSCHNNVYFGAAPPPNPLVTNGFGGKMVAHAGGQYADNSNCSGCHASAIVYDAVNNPTGAPIDKAHDYPVKIRNESDRWTYNLTAVKYNSATGQLDVTYRIDDGATVGVDYRSMAEFQQQNGGGSGGINIKVAWPAWEYANDGQNDPAQFAAAFTNDPGCPLNPAAGTSCALSPGQAAPASAMSQSVVDVFPTNGGAKTYTNAPSPDGACPGSTCTFTKTLWLPKTQVNAYGETIPVPATNVNSLAVFLDGHPVGLIQVGFGNNGVTPAASTAHGVAEPRYRSVPAKSTLTYWEISTNSGALTAATALDPTSASNAGKVRRAAVDTVKCQNCHTTLTLHGANRSDDTQVCVACHNPNNTDMQQRALVSSSTAGGDGMREQWISFGPMIHGIHAGGKLSPNTNNHTTYSGFREKGIIVAGNGGSINDFTGTAFPGRLDNCQNCHLEGTYELPLSSDLNPTTWQTVPAAVNGWEAQRHTFATTQVTNNGGLQISLSGATAVTWAYITGGSIPITFFPSGDAILPGNLTAGNTYYACSPAVDGSGNNTFIVHTNNTCSAAVAFANVGNKKTQTGSGYFSVLPLNSTNAATQYNMSPTAAACTGCHDEGLTKAHAISTGLAVLDKDYTVTPATATTMLDSTYNASQLAGYGAGLEVCPVCHGAGGIVDVEKVHKIGGD